MKKLTMMVIVVLILSGCGVKKETATGVTVPTDNKNVFTSIKEAVAKQLVLKCDYTDKDGVVTTTYIKGSVVRLKGSGSQANVDGLMKEGKFYLWDSVKKEGMELDLEKMAADGSVKMDGAVIKNVDDVVGVLEKNKDKCSLSPESAGLLELPTDIKFTKADDIFGAGSTK